MVGRFDIQAEQLEMKGKWNGKGREVRGGTAKKGKSMGACLDGCGVLFLRLGVWMVGWVFVSLCGKMFGCEDLVGDFCVCVCLLLGWLYNVGRRVANKVRSV